MACPLCNSNQTTAYCSVHEIQYLNCNKCELVFKDASHFLSNEEEKERYLLHENDVADKNYQKFVSPIVDSVLKYHPVKCNGLDFGAGSGSCNCQFASEENLYHQSLRPFLLSRQKMF